MKAHGQQTWQQASNQHMTPRGDPSGWRIPMRIPSNPWGNHMNSQANTQAPGWRPGMQRPTAPSAQSAPSGGGGGGGGFGAPSGPTPEQRRAAGNLGIIAGWNAGSTTDQHGRQLGNFDMSDEQNRALADVQIQQAQRQAAGDRFARNRNMQTMSQGLTSQMGNAMQGSGLFGFMDMLRGRTDLDNNAVWQQLTQNRNQIENSFTEAYNANRLARNDATINAEFALRGIEGDHAAQLNNIHPDLFVRPGSGAASHGSAGFFDQHRVQPNLAQLAGYTMPNNAAQGAANVQGPNQLGGPGTFAALMNQYNQRSR